MQREQLGMWHMFLSGGLAPCMDRNGLNSSGGQQHSPHQIISGSKANTTIICIYSAFSFLEFSM